MFVSEFIWSQEEPRNAGAYDFVSRRLENALGLTVAYAGRKELAWTATAIAEYHNKEIKELMDETFNF